ncbi:MAG: metal-dependent transcriptional regulator [Bacilli bacterium]|nr:metal-dependent transcriptional regulator [Bacilli bacterium]
MESKKYSESLENYLEAICMHGGNHVKSVDLANQLNVTRASVNKAINTLIEKGLVNKELYGDISLTDRGKEISNKILWKHKLLRSFLVDVLGVTPEVANTEACGIEHSISDDTAEKLELLVNKLKIE